MYFVKRKHFLSQQIKTYSSKCLNRHQSLLPKPVWLFKAEYMQHLLRRALRHSTRYRIYTVTVLERLSSVCMELFTTKNP